MKSAPRALHMKFCQEKGRVASMFDACCVKATPFLSCVKRVDESKQLAGMNLKLLLSLYYISVGL